MSTTTYLKKVAFNNIDSGDNATVYTTEYALSRITIAFTSFGPITGSESLIAWVNSPFGEEDAMLAEAYGPTSNQGSSLTDGRVTYYTALVDAGRTVKVNPQGENGVFGDVYIERMAVPNE